MKIRILGSGWYGSHLAASLLDSGHDIEVHEIADRLFAGASGSNPARLHAGFHYPRSALTRLRCALHKSKFMEVYGQFTRAVPVNIYAIAAHDSLVDWGTYLKVVPVPNIPIRDPSEFGLQNVEGAMLTGERHIVIDDVRDHFAELLKDVVRYDTAPGEVDDPDWDLTIDCTFCALDAEDVDRYEPCLVLLLRGPSDKAVTIMDGPFPSLYPWNEAKGLSSLSSALWTPLSKKCQTYQEALDVMASYGADELIPRADAMTQSMEQFYPAIRSEYVVTDWLKSIRAMPRSGADARLVDVIRVGERGLRIRAGKIDAIMDAEQAVKDHIEDMPTLTGEDARRRGRTSRLAAQ